ncbi:S9 family peptidase [Sphingomonas sp.]|uniref:S9 family peptidase n=1 Tax=Sphingomonas sp. TaxID=28214 RepID=UPI002D7F8900|nr:prolyl oligopeptidase family serine peptidase [Sphingomonas sp.]HEU0044160.1 prolyl oligopeptidase family serine peptidase [Sphingomonas sp.]
MPVEVFAQFPQLDGPRLSPNGKYLALKVRSNGGQALAIVPLAGGKPELISRDGAEAANKEGDRQVQSWRWLDDDHLLIAISYRENYMGDWQNIQRFAVVNRTTRKAIPLAWTDSIVSQFLLWASQEGPPRVLLQRISNKDLRSTTTPEVIEVDGETGRYKVVQPQNILVRSWDVDETGVVRLGSSSDGDTGKLRMLYRSNAGENFRTIVRERTNLYDDVVAPALLLKGDKAYAYSRKDGFRALYEYDLATLKLGKRVFGADGYDIDGALVAPTGDRLDGVSVTTDRTQMRWFDPRLKEIQSVLEQTGGPGNVAIVSADRAREKIVFRMAKLGQAPGFYLFDTAAGSISLIGWQNDTLKGAQLNPVSLVRYPTGDGKQIEAVLTMPRHKAGQNKLALVVLPHGGPWSRDDADWDPYGWAQAIAELGYVVIQPNFRGSTGYGRAWEAEAEGKWGYRMSDDLNDAIPFLAKQGIVDSARVCMFGWSYGGYASARAAQRDGKLYRCAIAGAAPVDMSAMVAYDRNYLGRYRAKQALGSASSNLDDISPALKAGEVSAPLLIVHGAKDQRVPVAQARDFVARLKKAGKVEGKDFLYLEQKENTHNLLREADRVELLRSIKDFLAKHNPA